MRTRERTLAIVAGAIAGLWLLDAVTIEPTLGWYRTVVRDGDQAAHRVAEARVLVDRAPRIREDWRTRHATGLLDGEDQARFRLQEVLAAAARHSGVAIDSAGGGQRVPAVHGSAYDTIRLSLSAQGSLAEVLAFLAQLEGAAMPLTIERGELAARDPRKDQLDLALTVSTRLASPAARADRRLPPDQTPWKPDPVATKNRDVLLAAQPFLTDRRSKRQDAPAAVAVAPTGGTWGLVGIVTRDGVPTGFLRHTGNGSEQALVDGMPLPEGAGTVAAITAEGLSLTAADGATRTITVGSDLAGQPLVPSAPVATTSSASAAPGAPADREAILLRLRQKRNKNH